MGKSLSSRVNESRDRFERIRKNMDTELELAKGVDFSDLSVINELTDDELDKILLADVIDWGAVLNKSKEAGE